MSDQHQGMASWGVSMQGLPTLEQYNNQVRMQQNAERPKAGVLCQCGTEMVYANIHPNYNISHGNTNHMSGGMGANVQCPSCGKTGFKMGAK
jgi:hypothetical protein